MSKYVRNSEADSRGQRRAMVTLSKAEAELARAIAEEQAIPFAVLLRSWIVQELRRQAAARQRSVD